jgi:hypothetical protein
MYASAEKIAVCREATRVYGGKDEVISSKNIAKMNYIQSAPTSSRRNR